MNKFSPFMIVIVLTSFLCACTDDFPESERIRPFYGLVDSDIPYAENMDPEFDRNPEIYSSWLVDGSAYANYSYSWYNYSDSSYLNVTISITESFEDASLVLNEKSKLNNLDWCYYLEDFVFEVDEVTVAGTKSMGNGQLFMRDNIVVLIKTGFRYCDLIDKQTPDYSIPDIASAIDRKIKKSKTYASASELKPVIKDIIFEKYPIPYAENINVTLLVERSESLLQTKFDFPRSRFYGTSITSGVFWLDTLCKYKNNEYKLCVLAISKEGFCDDSTFVIQIKP